MNTSETLNKAADLIETHGLGAGNSAMRVGFPEGACLEGALGAVLKVPVETGEWSDGSDDNMPRYGYKHVQACPAYAAVRTYLLNELTRHEDGEYVEPLWSWSDNQYRKGKFTRAIEVLRACALVEASRERQAVSA
jgi:hypothetical protein